MRQLRYIFLIFITIGSNLALASNQEFIVSPSLYIFDYAEYDTANNFLDGETGVMPGIYFAYQYHHQEFSVLAQYSEYGGDIDYDGQTISSNTPHTTLTDTHLRFINISLYSLADIHGNKLFLRFGSNYWDRNILPSGNVNGLHETYRWQELALGIRNENSENLLNIWAEFSVLMTHKPNMDIFLPSETLNFSLGTDMGYRIEIGRYFNLDQEFEIGVGGFFEHWRFGASEPQYAVDFEGILPNPYILEPDSESHHWGLRLNLRYRY